LRPTTSASPRLSSEFGRRGRLSLRSRKNDKNVQRYFLYFSAVVDTIGRRVKPEAGGSPFWFVQLPYALNGTFQKLLRHMFSLRGDARGWSLLCLTPPNVIAFLSNDCQHRVMVPNLLQRKSARNINFETVLVASSNTKSQCNDRF
jgi:hypothetical protein